MGVYKEGKNWKVQVYYKDWQGNRKRKQKRGFRTKGEAKEWERDFLQQQSQGVDIEFGNFLEIYYKDMDVRLRENTMYTKRYIIDLKIKPYFEKKILSEITVADVRAWQNELLTYKDKNGKGYSPTYLKTVNCQLTAIFNYAKDAAEFLKNEYGTGGAAPGIPGAYESDASHDAKGLKLAKGKIGSPDVEVLLKWNKVAERVRQLIRTDDFLSPEELEKYEERQEAQRQADLEGAQQALEVEQEGSDQQEIREENQEPSEVETQPEAVEDAEKKEDITPEQSDIPATNFHITDDELGQGTPKEKFRANIMAIQLLKKCEEENRNATPDEQEILSRYVGWGGLADAFDETKSAWETEYLELKTVLTPEEYAAARASTLNAHYTQPIVIESMYQALENLGFTKGNILDKTTPRLIQFHTLKNAANPPLLGGFSIFGTVAA